MNQPTTDTTLRAHPPIHRSSMVPKPWAGHPFLRPLRRLFGHKIPNYRQAGDDRPLMLRRVALLVLVALGAIVGTDTMIDVLPLHGGSWPEQGLLLLFAVLFAWISAGFWTGVMGAWVLLRGKDRNAVTNSLRGPQQPIAAEARTAIIMPICNEDVSTVFAGLRATYESLARSEGHGQFDFFILSDTNQPDLRAAEQAAWTQLVGALKRDDGTPVRVYYRWRQHRSKRKAGNVADFCRRWGADYRYMVVLDADSVMTGDCLTGLVRLMEAHTDAGIIQTAPRACGHETLHARIQQFGSRVYGPLFTAGMHFWQLGESHYWGHNAILRVAPFIEHCALAPIPGQTSLSGDVMSHDFVEAALMRRAGWKVWIAYDLDGSYEQVPPNLLTEVQRDRRWCHGNLQNSRLMFEPGLHPVHRTVFLTGVLAYASAPLWLAFLLVSTVLFASQVHEIPKYFIEPYQLFPIWPTVNLKLMLTLFGLTAVLLLAPKLMSLLIITLRGQAREFGGVLRLWGGAVIEFLHSLLLAPVRMLFHSQFVLAALTGWKLDWKSPPRGESVTPWSEALRRHGVHSLLAVVWVGAILYSGAAFPWWLSPIIVGLLAAIPISAWASHSGPGRWLRARGVLLIPEEVHEPEVLREARRYAEGFDGELRFDAVVRDAEVHHRVTRAVAVHAPARGAKHAARAALIATAARDGVQAINLAQRHRLLGDRHALRELHERVIQRQAHPAWWGMDDRRSAPRASLRASATWHRKSRVAIVDP
ncbi:MAG TPA: glucans biosynthesis glucosyltransferase MdoH [Burkholderiaceae bacterium]|jgi:membrane glycosyltransferase